MFKGNNAMNNEGSEKKPRRVHEIFAPFPAQLAKVQDELRLARQALDCVNYTTGKECPEHRATITELELRLQPLYKDMANNLSQ
ncbi:hypothetical protein L6270_03370 [Candidatus Parcubacteria bacterium]|nr:hypothetical protein [Patescibacteria group bacterium]MBU4309004.1 hypothetical protein [Patescibacteria group bacterium]MBU4432402.1 hypothetical protein [Patescibacteria group bacterium]MBU4577364.1 hypothetical protein [Patescibacteria group bacterium]MCG2697052.1 hypothetical protein [Candidatus Parcubacteria bacterium]